MSTTTLTHPGRILAHELTARGWSNHELERQSTRVGMPCDRITFLHILAGKHRISATMAIRLGRIFSTSAELWWGLQCTYDLERARQVLSA